MVSKLGRTSRKRELIVWLNGSRVGIWSTSPTTGHRFAYDEGWLNHPLRRPLSLSMPLTQGIEPFRGDVVESYFDNLLPDSRTIRTRLATHYGVNPKQAFALLEQIGRDCVGAVQLLPPDDLAPDVQTIKAKSVTEEEIEQRIERMLSGAPITQEGETEELRISMAGAQEKIALLHHRNCWCIPLDATPTTHILKLPLGLVGAMKADLSSSIENEWLCAKILTAYGLNVAECDITAFGRYKTLVVERFDRRLQEKKWWARLPQEDFCQVYGLPPERKYQADGGVGIDQILKTLRGSENAEKDRKDFLTAQFLFWLLAAPDGHAKNFSLHIEKDGRYRLTPFYDVMSAWPIIGTGANQFDRKKIKLAMGVKGKNMHYLLEEIRREHWNATAKRNGMGKDFEETITRILNTTPEVIRTVKSQLPKGFPTKVSRPIFEGMRSQAERLEAAVEEGK